MEKINAGGRPPKSIKKSKRISVACTPDELKIIKEKALVSRLSLSEYAMLTMLKKPLPKVPSPIHNEVIIKLTGMANNLNQIAKAINSRETAVVSNKLFINVRNLLEELKK